jgi:hypothetical protein
MILDFNALEIRVLGVLLEKQMTTPEYYPLTLNALTVACNQKSNRAPEMELGAGDVLITVNGLQDRRLVQRIFLDNSRVERFRHRFEEHFPFDSTKKAILCELFLRGPQTVGELRTHTARMEEIPALDEVIQHLDELAAHNPPLVMRLERQTGQKDARYTHLFSGQPEIPQPSVKSVPVNEPTQDSERFSSLEKRVAQLEHEMATLKQLLADKNN